MRSCVRMVISFGIIFIWVRLLLSAMDVTRDISAIYPKTTIVQLHTSSEAGKLLNNTTTTPNSSDADDYFLQESIQLYQRQAEERRFHLRSVLNGPRFFSYGTFYNNLAPEAYCLVLVRLGRTTDGGKWICNPFRIPRKSIVFTLGLRDEISFEKELQRVTNSCCYIYGYDYFEQKEETVKALTGVRTVTIAARTYEAYGRYTIEYLMKIENVTNIEILKLDIEGAEYDVLPPFLDSHRPAQVIVEIHGQPNKAAVMAKLVHEIAKRGYWMLSHEINGAHHECSEFVFIYEAAFSRYGVVPMARYLD